MTKAGSLDVNFKAKQQQFMSLKTQLQEELRTRLVPEIRWEFDSDGVLASFGKLRTMRSTCPVNGRQEAVQILTDRIMRIVFEEEGCL